MTFENDTWRDTGRSDETTDHTHLSGGTPVTGPRSLPRSLPRQDWGTPHAGQVMLGQAMPRAVPFLRFPAGGLFYLNDFINCHSSSMQYLVGVETCQWQATNDCSETALKFSRAIELILIHGNGTNIIRTIISNTFSEAFDTVCPEKAFHFWCVRV